MITLKTLPEATAQQVFDQVARHLLTQNAKSFLPPESGDDVEQPPRCAYRGENGMMCAAGCLIADDEYKPFEMEQKNWNFLSKKMGLDAHRELIISLQCIHDNRDPEEWREQLKYVAHYNHLGTEVLA